MGTDFYADMYGLRIGDRVFLSKKSYEAPAGLTGTIMDFHPNNVLIEFDCSYPAFHDGDGKCRDGHGYWVPYQNVRKMLDDTEDVIDTSEMNLDEFLGKL